MSGAASDSENPDHRSANNSCEPTAPPVDHLYPVQGVNPSSDHSSPSVGASYTNPAMNAGNGTTMTTSAVPYPDPPPSYQNAMSCPKQAPQPNVHPYPPQPYPAAVPPGYYPQNQALYPPNQAITVVRPVNPTPNANTTIVVQVDNGARCPHCIHGVVRKEPDACCLVFLILLTIFTFPIGLVFLCCMPCAVHLRCTNCGRHF